ncbi:MAG TPA: hypothetical protein VLX28_02695 [Thermoanaerobaculia bacterium]|nr:hypothetical protein [Thermoanaerobaculia bacterium]
MDDRDHLDAVRPYPEEDPVGKSLQEGSSDIAMDLGKLVWILRNRVQGLMDELEKGLSKAG